jgi:hypothetical protein
MSRLLYFLSLTETICAEKFSEVGDARRQKSPRGTACDHCYCGCDACWAHISLLGISISSTPESMGPCENTNAGVGRPVSNKRVGIFPSLRLSSRRDSLGLGESDSTIDP